MSGLDHSIMAYTTHCEHYTRIFCADLWFKSFEKIKISGAMKRLFWQNYFYEQILRSCFCFSAELLISTLRISFAFSIIKMSKLHSFFAAWRTFLRSKSYTNARIQSSERHN